MKIGTPKGAVATFFRTSPVIRWALLGLVLLVFGTLLFPGLIGTRPRYESGDVAERDIKAPVDFLVEDREATAARRQAAADAVLTVYDHNRTLLAAIGENIQAAFAQARDALRPPPSEVPAPHVAPPDMARLKESVEKTLAIHLNPGAFRILAEEGFSAHIADRIIQILEEILDNGVAANKELLLRESERGIVLRPVCGAEERVVRNLRRFYGLDQAKTMVRVVAEPLVRDLSYSRVNLVVDLAQRLIQPNITLNRNETENRKRAAAEAVKPILYQIKAGEMLLREGERVTGVQLLKLNALRSQKRQERFYVRNLGAVAMLLFLMVILFYLHVRQRGKRVFASNKDVLFLSSLLALFFLLPGASGILFTALAENTPLDIPEASLFIGVPLAAGPMTVCLFMGFEMAALFAVVLSACAAVLFHGRVEVFLYFFLSALMAAYWTQHCRERRVFINAGLKIGLLNIPLATAAAVHMGIPFGLPFLWGWLLAFLAGIATGILSAGIVPLLELAFGYTTDITLLELANMERPILRQLMIEAPGTYHHSVIVGSMVEAAATEIGANPLLAKVCGYYHDIGKIKKPLYFIENQTDGRNRHDKLAPSMSGLILISHVKDGVEIARKHKLGEEIIEAIRQHHGTSTITFFYERAKKLKGEGSVNVDDYRYPGPKPQTREVGLVMLADIVEAASRTLENPTPSRIQGLVQKLINKVFSDGQLDNCTLTLRDLHKIAKSFNKILNGIHHHRIEYPEKAAARDTAKKDAAKKEKHGRPDPKPPANGKAEPGTNATGGSDPLKRLGVS
ncbi:MAG: HD family phosphohydrolase [Desulfococcaceae bacterium]